MHIEVVSITVVPYYTVITRDVPVERDCNTITVLLLLLFQINNQSINQSISTLHQTWLLKIVEHELGNYHHSLLLFFALPVFLSLLCPSHNILQISGAWAQVCSSGCPSLHGLHAGGVRLTESPVER